MSRTKKGRGIWAYACTICSVRYEGKGVMGEGPRGGQVAVADKPGPCVTCRKGEPLPWWPEARQPQECCRQHSRLAHKDECDLYGLSPDCTWYICPECCRTHPVHDPTKETDDDAASRTERSRRTFRAGAGHPDVRGQASSRDEADRQRGDPARV